MADRYHRDQLDGLNAGEDRAGPSGRLREFVTPTQPPGRLPEVNRLGGLEIREYPGGPPGGQVTWSRGEGKEEGAVDDRPFGCAMEFCLGYRLMKMVPFPLKVLVPSVAMTT